MRKGVCVPCMCRKNTRKNKLCESTLCPRVPGARLLPPRSVLVGGRVENVGVEVAAQLVPAVHEARGVERAAAAVVLLAMRVARDLGGD